MNSRPILTFLSIVSALVAIVLVCLNFGLMVGINAGFATVSLPLGAALLATYACGLITIGCGWAMQKRREIKGEQKLVKWEKEDQKLMVELASDEKKLLEAKIATLEAALKSALKKKND